MARKRSLAQEVLLAVLATAIALFGGIDLIGTPLRLVHVLTLVTLSMAAGVNLDRAIRRFKERQHTDSSPE